MQMKPSCRARVVLFLLVGMALFPRLTRAEQVVLSNETLRIDFAADSEGFGVRGIRGLANGSETFVRSDGAEPDFWKVEFLRTDKRPGGNDHFPLTNLSPAQSRSVSIRDGVAVFTWKGLTLRNEMGCVDVTATVRLESGKSVWSIAVTNRSKVWALLRTTYPILRNVSRGASADLLIPSNNLGGRLLKGCFCGQFPDKVFPYPSDDLQLMAFMRGSSGLYFAAHDSESRIKNMTLEADGDCYFSTPVEDATRVGFAAEGPRYPVVVSCFQGDWWQAAKLYRSWALDQKWVAKGKLADRTDVARRALETDLWVTACGEPSKIDEIIAAMKEKWPDVGKNFSWGGWNALSEGTGSDRGVPESFPVKYPDTASSIRRWVSDDLLVLLYTNGRIWDPELASFEYARDDACSYLNGSVQTEWYGRPFAVMCPCCACWQDIVRTNAVRVLDELGANAVYFDQIAGAPPKECANVRHGHPGSGGTWWADGYRQMLEPLRAEFLKRGATMVSEQLGEAWLDLFDAYLNASQLTPEDVPLFPAVYAGYCVHYGRRRDPYDFTEFARTILWGEAAGWIGEWVLLDPVHANSAALHRRLAKFRRAHAEYLVYGSLEDELRPLESDKDIIGNVWRSADGSKWCTFVSNGAKVRKTVRFRSPVTGATVSLNVEPETIGTYEEEDRTGS